jgi:hypothetical protein
MRRRRRSGARTRELPAKQRRLLCLRSSRPCANPAVLCLQPRRRR